MGNNLNILVVIGAGAYGAGLDELKKIIFEGGSGRSERARAYI